MSSHRHRLHLRSGDELREGEKSLRERKVRETFFLPLYFHQRTFSPLEFSGAVVCQHKGRFRHQWHVTLVKKSNKEGTMEKTTRESKKRRGQKKTGTPASWDVLHVISGFVLVQQLYFTFSPYSIFQLTLLPSDPINFFALCATLSSFFDHLSLPLLLYLLFLFPRRHHLDV